MPLLFENESQINATVNAYANYLERFVGDAFGLQVGEGLRDEVSNGWYLECLLDTTTKQR